MQKCKTKDCNRHVEDGYIYCSIECACYDKAFDVKTGWTKDVNEEREAQD